MERRNECRDRDREREDGWGGGVKGALQKERRGIMEWGATDVSILKPLVLLENASIHVQDCHKHHYR